MGTLMTTNQKTARRKGLTAAAVAGTSALLLGSAPVLGVVGLVGAGYPATTGSCSGPRTACGSDPGWHSRVAPSPTPGLALTRVTPGR
jgi:hypothetical protein